MEAVKLVEVTRGKTVESIHRGVIAVVDAEGKKIASVGDSSYFTFIRSAAKPIQALPVLETGAAQHFAFNLEDLALMMASHSGEPEHVRIGRQIIDKIGVEPEILQCGVHPPLHRPSAHDLEAKGQEPNVFHCTCSGKHAAMLAIAKHMDFSLRDYFLPEHPVQQLMRQTIAAFAGLDPGKIGTGTDGCGVPVFALPVEKMAYIYARWADAAGFDEERNKACLTLQQAITTYPEIVAGTGRFTYDLMKVTGTKILAKDGNEGVFCIGIPDKGWGIAIKIEDGHTRAVNPVVVETLHQLGILTTQEYAALLSYQRKELKNYRGELIGEIRPAFRLGS